mmetsp:Transcript_91816/g.143207  ORF Transcript_91816/g.143207 Transcript_91816/m.143207 type:complete len:195 (+) Transcript_91816:90-674(+)
MALSLLCCYPRFEKNRRALSSNTSFRRIYPESLFEDDCDSSKQKDSKYDLEEKVVLELHGLAIRMTKNIRKYPNSSKKFQRWREQFISALPAQEGTGLTPLQRWQHGCVVFWEDKASFTSSSKPTNRLSLLRIAKVQHLEKQGNACGVMIKHRPENDVEEIMLIFPTRNEAKEFSDILWELIAKLRSHLHKVSQ